MSPVQLHLLALPVDGVAAHKLGRVGGAAGARLGRGEGLAGGLHQDVLAASPATARGVQTDGSRRVTWRICRRARG